MTSLIDLNREENYLVKATLIVRGTEINGVPCKIYLPERIHEKPYVLLKPSKQDANQILASYKGALKATIYGFDGEIKTTIAAPEVYFSGGSTKRWGDDISETTVPGEPQDLHIIHHLENDAYGDETHILFWISPNEFLTPFMAFTNSYTGEIKCERVENIEFTIKDGLKLVFEKHFNYRTEENRGLLRWSFLVACAELNIPSIDVETLKNNTLNDIDDFLLIASFTARKRTACVGWTATDKNSHTTFYRGNYTFPQKDNNTSLDDGIVDIKDFKRFMETCYPTFLRFENKLALRNAFYAAVPSKPHTIETSFLHMFAGLETLILDFKRRENLEFVLPENVWLTLKKYLEKCVKKSTNPKLEREQRASIYCKLDELNRVSFREAFEGFCEKYSIDLVDLWPVFGKKGVKGLTDIRNKLIHGDPFPHDLFGALIVANEHLQYTLERVLVRVLGWDVGETKVKPSYLRVNLCAIKELPSALVRLSEYMRNQESVKEMSSGEVNTGPIPEFCEKGTAQRQKSESDDSKAEK